MMNGLFSFSYHLVSQCLNGNLERPTSNNVFHPLWNLVWWSGGASSRLEWDRFLCVKDTSTKSCTRFSSKKTGFNLHLGRQCTMPHSQINQGVDGGSQENTRPCIGLSNLQTWILLQSSGMWLRERCIFIINEAKLSWFNSCNRSGMHVWKYGVEHTKVHESCKCQGYSIKYWFLNTNLVLFGLKY